MGNDSEKKSIFTIAGFKVSFIDEPCWYWTVVIGMALLVMIGLAAINREYSLFAVAYQLASNKMGAIWSWWPKRKWTLARNRKSISYGQWEIAHWPF